jgi:hypothetical protein
MDGLKELLGKTTGALVNAGLWMEEKKIGQKMMMTGATVGALGIVYLMAAAGHGISMETDVLVQSGTHAMEVFQNAQQMGLEAITGDISKINSVSDLANIVPNAIKAPFSNNMLIESWRGLSISATGVAGLAVGLLGKVGLGSISDTLKDIANKKNDPEMLPPAISSLVAPVISDARLDFLLSTYEENESLLAKVQKDSLDKLGVQVNKGALRDCFLGQQKNTSHTGEILGVDYENGLVFQKTGPGQAIVHHLHDFNAVPVVGQTLKIEHGPNGFASHSVVPHVKSLEADRSPPEGMKVVQDGRHVGIIADIHNGFAIQSIGRGQFVAHDLSRMDKAPTVGEKVDLQYKNGRTLDSQAQSNDRGR